MKDQAFLFPIFILFFLLDDTANTLLNGSLRNRHPCFVPDLMGNAFTLPLLTMILVLAVFYRCYISGWGSFVLFLTYWMLLIMVDIFLHLFKFFFMSVYMVNYINWFPNVEPNFNSWDKPYLVIMFFTCCYILFAKILEMVFVSMFMKNIL